MQILWWSERFTHRFL